MRASTHDLIGVSLALAAARALEAGPVESAGLAATALWGSRLPDVDQLGSRIHRRTRLERRSLLVGVAGLALRLPTYAFATVVPHRGVTHSILACSAAGGLAALVASPFGEAAALVAGGGMAVGYGAHVAADACTPGGVRLWAPVSGRRVWLLPRPLRVRTGSFREAGLAAVTAAALVVTLLA